MQVRDIMAKDVACLNTEDSIEQAAVLMKQYNVGSVPVCMRNQVIGIVTDRDIALRSVAEGHQGEQMVEDVMTRNPIVASPQMDVHEAARIMSNNQIRRLPVVEDNGQLVGIVALGDISLQPELQEDAEQALQNISMPNSFQ